MISYLSLRIANIQNVFNMVVQIQPFLSFIVVISVQKYKINTQSKPINYLVFPGELHIFAQQNE